jgi:hypothetical protein
VGPVKSHLTIIQHAEKAVRYERTAAALQVRGITEPTPPETFWQMAAIHRAWVAKLRTSV